MKTPVLVVTGVTLGFVTGQAVGGAVAAIAALMAAMSTLLLVVTTTVLAYRELDRPAEDAP